MDSRDIRIMRITLITKYVCTKESVKKNNKQKDSQPEYLIIHKN